jgi:hypothetical protein
MRLLPFVLALTIAAPGTWTRQHQEKSRSLTYTGTATLLGKETPVTLRFYCNPERTADGTGVIGYELEVANPDALKPFDFDDFEGPDAPTHARKLLQASVLRGGKSVHSVRESPSGFYVRNVFVFEVSKVFDEPGSSAKKTLRALTQDAGAFRITITDYRKADLKLEVTVPIKGKRGDFAWLVAELK